AAVDAVAGEPSELLEPDRMDDHAVALVVERRSQRPGGRSRMDAGPVDHQNLHVPSPLRGSATLRPTGLPAAPRAPRRPPRASRASAGSRVRTPRGPAGGRSPPGGVSPLR